MKLQGTITALVTQFKENGDVDYDAFRTHVRDQIKNGINGIVPLGTTGEAPTIEHDEKEQIIKISVQEAKGKIPVIVGTGSNSTKKTIEETAMAARLGADAALIVTPYYNKPTQEGIYRHFEAVTKAVNIPVVVYNIKGRTGVNIETSTMKRLAGLKNIIAVKEASGDILFPKQTTAMTAAALQGEWEKARKIHYELLPFMKVAFIETNPVPIKTAMNLCGWKGGSFRLPMCEMQQQNKEKLAAVLKSMGVMK